MSIRNLSDTRVEDALEIFSPSSIVKLDFVQTHGNWKIEAGNSGNNTLIIGSVSNATNNITLDTTNGGSATFAGTISSKDISIKQLDDSGFDGGLTIERSANTQKVHIGMDGGAVNFNSPGGLSYKFRNNGTEKFTVDGSGNATFAGNISVGGGQIITPGGVNLALNPNTGTVTVGGIIQCSGAGTSSFAGTVATTALDVQRSSGSNDDILRITSADVVTTIQRIENSSDAASGFGRIEFKTNAATGQVSGRGGFKFIDGDGNDILYLDNDNAAATFAGKVNINDNGGLYLNVNSAAQSDIAVFKNNNGSIVLGYTSNLASIDLGSSQAIRIRQGSNVPLTIDSSGNVGIGVTSPNAKLEISGTSEARYLQVDAIAGFAGISSSMGAMVEFFNSGDGNNVKIKTNNSSRTDAAPFSVWTDSNSRFLVRNDGRVGIGATSPAEKLEVSGSIKVGNMKLEPANGGRIGFNRNTSNGVIYDSNYAAFQINGASSGNDFLEIQNYNSSGNFLGSVALKNGQFGIGTTSPEKKLHVKGTTSDATPQVLIQNSSTGDASVQYNVSGQSYVMGIDYDDSKKFKIASSGNLGTTDRVTLLSTGQVGIGTITPASDLHILGISNDTVSQANANLNVEGQGGNGIVVGTIASSPFSTYIQSGFVDNFSTAVYPISLNPSGGNVGIGTNSPSQKLDVNGKGAFGGTGSFRTFISGGGGGSFIEFGTDADNDSLGHLGTFSSAMVFDTNQGLGYLWRYAGGTKMALTSGGKLGIGNTSPNYLLEVGNSTQTNSNVFSGRVNGDFIFNLSKANTNLFSIRNDTTNAVHLNTQNSAKLALGVSTGTSTGSVVSNLVIDSSGNVGIGTSSPSYKLEVNGTANIVSHLTAHCLGVGTAAPAANGVIRAAGDVIAYYSSDQRLKNNITKIEKPLEKLEKINGYEFDWNDKQELYEGHDVGVVAQEIEEVYPQLVETREDGYKAVKYEKLVPLLIESIKELKKEIDNIKNKSWQSDY